MKLLALITTLLVVIVQPAAAQDYSAGLAAYKRDDDATAFKIFKSHAEQGHVQAQELVGTLYSDGKGVLQNYVKVVKWFRKSAEQGHAHSENHLGVMYEDGKGVLKDLIMAYVWYNVAAANGENKYAAPNLDTIEKKLTKAELKKARTLSKRCLKKPANCPEYSN